MSLLNLIPGLGSRRSSLTSNSGSSKTASGWGLDLEHGFLSKVHFPAPIHPNGRTGYHIYSTAYLDLNKFKVELLVLTITAITALWYLLVRSRNRRKAYNWVRTVLPELEQEFSNIATSSPYGKSPIVWNGAAEGVFFATGRRAVDTLHAFFQFTPIHDPLYMGINALLNALVPSGSVSSYERNFLSISLTLSQSPDNISGIFALIDKSALRQTKTAARFDLSFGKLLEANGSATQRKLDEKWAILSESGELTDMYLGEINEKGQSQREKLGIYKILDPNNPASKWLESLVITDQPLQRPPGGPIATRDKPRRVILTLRIPSTVQQAKETLPLLGLALDIADGLVSSNPSSPLKLRPDTINKLRKIREGVDKELEDEARKEEREAEEERKAEAKAKADKLKWDSLSPAEQERKKEIEKKRQMKKGVKAMKK